MRICAILLLCSFCGYLSAQSLQRISGLVTDVSGEPLIGVSVLVKETQDGTITDIDGNLQLMPR